MIKHQKIQKAIGVFTVAAVMLTQTVIPVFGAVSENGIYINHYDTQADLGNFHLNEGDPLSCLVLNGDKNILPYPDESGYVTEMQLIKTDSVTDASYNHEFKENPVYSFGEDEKVSVEMKVRFQAKGNVKKVLRLDDTVNNVNGEALIQFDDGQINASSLNGNLALAGTKAQDYVYVNDEWYQIFLVLYGNSYDVYFQNEKLNDTPLILSNGNQKQITRVVNNHRTWSNESSYYDDLIIQPLDALRLDSSTIEESAVNVSEKTQKLVLDFNTPLNPETVSNLTVTDANGTLADQYLVELDSIDMTRINIAFPAGLTLSNTYTINYGGLSDLMGSVLDTQMQFTTREQPSPAFAQMTSPENGEEEVSLRPEVTFTFNKTLDSSTIDQAVVSTEPVAEVDAVTLKGENTVAVTFGKDLRPNRTYTVTLGGGIRDLEDGMEISPASVSFTTAYTTDMVLDEFEFGTTGFIPQLVGITDKTGKVVNPSDITSNNLGMTVDVANPENYDGDTSRIFLGGAADDTRLIYRLDSGIRDAVLRIYNNPNPSTESAFYDLEFAVAESLGDLNDTSTYIDVTDQVEKTQLSQSAKDNFYPFSYTYRAEEKEYPYFIIRMRRRIEGSAWATKIASIKFNSLLPEEGTVAVIKDSQAVQADAVDAPGIPFTIMLDDQTLRPEQFVVNGQQAKGVSVDASGTKVILTLAEPLDYSSTYSLEVGEGILDLYGRPIAGGTYTLFSPHQAALENAGLAGMETLPASGKVTPKADITCLKDGASVTVYAVYYANGKIQGISMGKEENLVKGTKTVSLPELQIDTEANDAYVKIFARTNEALQRPLSGITLIDASGTQRIDG